MGMARTILNKQGRKRSAFGYVKAHAGVPRAERMAGKAPPRQQRIDLFASACIAEALG